MPGIGVSQEQVVTTGPLLLAPLERCLVHGVVSLSGGNTVTCSATPGTTIDACRQAPFTSGGKPVSYTRQFDNPEPTDDPSAIIPVEEIKGPVVAVCGGADNEWNACQLSLVGPRPRP